MVTLSSVCNNRYCDRDDIHHDNGRIRNILIKMVTSKYYYRMDGRNGSICDRTPKTKEQVEAIKNWKERERWMRVACPDGKMRAYQRHKHKIH